MIQNQTQQSCNITIGNKSFKNVSHFKYLGKTLTNINEVHDAIRRINFGKACYHTFYFQNSEAGYTK
jgi:hypothetical protein